jgi:hypothetical protein
MWETPSAFNIATCLAIESAGTFCQCLLTTWVSMLLICHGFAAARATLGEAKPPPKSEEQPGSNKRDTASKPAAVIRAHFLEVVPKKFIEISPFLSSLTRDDKSVRATPRFVKQFELKKTNNLQKVAKGIFQEDRFIPRQFGVFLLYLIGKYLSWKKIFLEKQKKLRF